MVSVVVASTVVVVGDIVDVVVVVVVVDDGNMFVDVLLSSSPIRSLFVVVFVFKSITGANTVDTFRNCSRFGFLNQTIYIINYF